MCPNHLCVLDILIFLLLNKIPRFPAYNNSAFVLHLTTKSRRKHCSFPHVGETLLLSISEGSYLKERERVNVHLDIFFSLCKTMAFKARNHPGIGKKVKY